LHFYYGSSSIQDYLKNRKDRAVARFFSQYTQTKGGGPISSVSLLSKFYNHEGNVQEVVKAELLICSTMYKNLIEIIFLKITFKDFF
jgi:hypothetical protein